MRSTKLFSAILAATLLSGIEPLEPRARRFRDDEPEPRPPRGELAPNAPRNSSREEARRRRQRERAK